MREVCQRRGVRRIAAVATAAVREADNGKAVRPAGSAKSWTSPPHHRRRDRGGALLPLGRAPFPAGRRAHARRRHRRRQPRADRRGGWPGRADRLAAARRRPPHRAAPPAASDSARKRSRRCGSTSPSSSSAASPAANGPPRRSSARGGTFTSLGRMVQARRGLPAGDSVHGLSCHRPPRSSSSSTGSQPHAGAAPAGAGSQPRAGRHHPRRARGHRRAARPRARAEHHRQRVRAARGTAAGDGGRRRTPAAPDPLRLFREFAERCQCDRRHVEQVRYLALQLFDQLGEELAAAPRSARCSRRPRCSTTSASW